MNKDTQGLIHALLEHEIANGADDLQTGLRDALTDILHLAEAYDLSFDAAVKGAKEVFKHEKEITNA